MLFLLIGLLLGPTAAQVPNEVDAQLDAQKKRATKLLQEGKIEEARQEFVRLVTMITPKARFREDWEIYGHLQVAECYAILGKYEDSERQLEPLAIKYPVPHALSAMIYKDLGHYQLLLWKLDKAEPTLEAAVMQFRRANNRYTLWGKESTIHPLQAAQTLSRLGRAHKQNHHNSRAEKVFVELEGILGSPEFRKFDKDPRYMLVRADCVDGLAEVDWRNYLTARSILRRARLLSELKTDLSNVPNSEFKFELIERTIMVSRFLANCHSQIHYYRDAYDVLDQAAPLLRQLRNNRNIRLLGGNLNDQLAQVKIAEVGYKFHDALDLEPLLKDIEIATEIADRASSDYRAIAGEEAAVTQELVTANANLSSTFALINKVRGELLERMSKLPESQTAYGAALSHVDSAIHGFSSGLRAEHDVLAKLHRERAWLLWKRGNLDEARDVGIAALQTAQRNHEPDWVGFGQFYSTLLCIENAAGRFDSARLYADRHRRLMSQSLLTLAAQMTPAEQVSFFREYDEEGFQASLLLGSRTKEFWRESAEWLLNGKAKGIEVFAEATRRETGNAKMKNLVARQSYNLYGKPQVDRLDVLEAEKEKRGIALARPGEAVAAKWLDLKELPLQDDEVYVDIVALREMSGGQTDYYAWVVVKPGDVHVIKLGDAATIEPLVRQAIKRMGLDDPIEEDLGLIAGEKNLKRTCLSPLSEILLRPIEIIAGHRSQWIISPDGPLWNLPWAMLLTDDDQYAVEKITFRHVVSGRDLYQRKPEKTAAGPPLIFADPDFESLPKGIAVDIRRTDQGNFKHFDGAKGTGAQGNEVGKLFPDGAVLTRDRATKAALFEMKAAPRILYLATHGFFKEPASGDIEDPFLCSGIALAGYNTRDQQRQELPGLLTAAEVLCAPVRGTDLVVLSSCQTSVGNAVYSHSSTSMRHAFHLAGARAVVASLWKVDSERTRDLMVRFMQEVASGKDKAKALQRAQQSMIQRLRQDEQHAHPAWWAAFTLSGF